jgi:hypothetical protein
MILKRFIVAIAIVFVTLPNVFAIRISGYVRDSQSQEVLIGANIRDNTNQTGTTTDNRGYYNIDIPFNAKLIISFIGYCPQEHQISSQTDSVLMVNLVANTHLQEIVVTAFQHKTTDVTRVSLSDISRTPSIWGKPDLLKTLQLIPGVQSQSEGMSMIVVRGGEPGQNQYLLDKVPLIYVNHLGGLISVFNPEMINSVDFYKGSFPAKYGGKVSSIIDITQREGNVSKHQGSVSLGITDVSFSFEGPFALKKSSYIITARKTLVDGFLAGITASSEDDQAVSTYGFHDINAKISWKPDDSNIFNLNIYQGDDYLNIWTKPWKYPDNEQGHVKQQWGNWLVSGRWNSLFKSGLFAENILSFSRYRYLTGQTYRYQQDSTMIEIERRNISSLNDYSYRSLWKYSFGNKWDIEFGGQFSFLNYFPDYNYLSIPSETTVIGNKFNAQEISVFIENKIQLTSNFRIDPALRIIKFIHNGISFTEPEPRLSLQYNINQNQNIHLNLMRVTQSSHLIYAQSEILKKEVWLPSTFEYGPEISNQISANWNGVFKNGMFDAEMAVYYKNMSHLITLKEGYENMQQITSYDNKIETDGNGIAYGAEFILKKN